VTGALAALAAALADRYRVERELGRGGMATVYLARDLKHDRPVALKVLKPELAAVLGPERFLREVKTTAQLTHPHILPLHDSGNADGFLYYVMPYVEGESLRDRLNREKQLPLDDTLQISREVADALSYAHAHGVIHRDIKPENILLGAGHAVVADFGIARAIDAAGGDRLTETGLAIGTPAYMSPEQAGGSRELDGRSDLYSLGCVLYEMLAGQPPFTGPTVESVVHQHLAAEPPSITTIRPAVPGWVAAALARSLAKTPADRFNPVAQFGEALAPRMPSPDAPMWAAGGPGRRSSRRWVAAAFAIAVAVLGGWGAWWALQPDDVVPPVVPRAYTIVAELDGTADLSVRRTVRAIIAAALDESRLIAAVPDDQIRRGLALAGRPDTTTLTLAIATELAVRGAIRSVIAGSVDRVGATYHVSVRVLHADSGTVLVAERTTAGGDDELIQAADRLARAIREGLGERPEAIAPTHPIYAVQTPSFAAWQRYRQGLALARSSDWAGARREYEAALGLDPEFASAWQNLGNVLGNLGEPEASQRALDSALAHADRLTDRERLRLEIRRATDPAVAAELARRHIQLFGPTEWGVATLALELGRMGRLDEAIRVSTEMEQSPPPYGFQATYWSNYALYLARIGRIDEAREKAGNLTGLLATQIKAQIALAAAEWSAADSLARLYLRDRPEAAGGGLWALAAVAASRGQVHGAMRHLRQSVEADRTASRLRAQQAGGAMLVLAVVSGSMLDVSELPTVRVDTAPGATLAALWAAAAGDTARARVHLAAIRAMPAAERGPVDTALTLGDAWLALAAGQPEATVTLIRPVVRGMHRAQGPLPINQLMRWTLAEAYARISVPDSAAAWLERIAQWEGQVWGWDDGWRGLTYSFVHFRLGRIYAQAGRPDDAKQHYAMFLDAFTDPDSEYQWMVTEARARLQELAMGR
jgi:tetratricopeptide (TPR) repeat protein